MRPALVFLFASLLGPTAWADVRSGVFPYGSERQCVSARVFSSAQCRIAQTNAEAEFDEKVAHFAARGSCEQAFGRSRCMIGSFASLSGSGSGVYFVPRSDGFVISVRAANQISVVPLARARSAGRFQSRSIAKFDTSRSLQGKARGGGSGSRAQVIGVEVPAGTKGEFPPAQVFQSGFDCRAVVEASRNKDDPGCFPVGPAMRRHLQQRD
jgi:uncharacterized protein YgiB involved in biofilm formation